MASVWGARVAASKQESSQIGSLNAKLSLYTAFLRAKTAWVNFFLLISDLTVFNLSERETFRSFCQIFSSVKEPSLNDLWSSATFEAANSDVEIIRFLMKPKAEACSTLLQNLHLQRPKNGETWTMIRCILTRRSCPQSKKTIARMVKEEDETATKRTRKGYGHQWKIHTWKANPLSNDHFKGPS